MRPFHWKSTTSQREGSSSVPLGCFLGVQTSQDSWKYTEWNLTPGRVYIYIYIYINRKRLLSIVYGGVVQQQHTHLSFREQMEDDCEQVRVKATAYWAPVILSQDTRCMRTASHLTHSFRQLASGPQKALAMPFLYVPYTFLYVPLDSWALLSPSSILFAIWPIVLTRRLLCSSYTFLISSYTFCV